jgi:CO/xanthine dehydrogenase Mo-binding subunit
VLRSHIESRHDLGKCRAPDSPVRSTRADDLLSGADFGEGCGEVGTIASPATVINAVVDALSPYGITHLDMPATPQRIWDAIRASRQPASS